MRDIAVEVTIPKNTLRAAPVDRIIPLERGVLSSIWLAFPMGCARMVYVQFYINDRMIAPYDLDQAYGYDNVQIPIELHEGLSDAPYEVIVRGWSDNTRYDHTLSIIFRISTENDPNSSVLRALIG